MSGIEDDTEERVRRRAYELWEEAGQPEGRGHEFWQDAWAEVTSESGSLSAPSLPMTEAPAKDERFEPGKPANRPVTA